jgi:hypothetical protein
VVEAAFADSRTAPLDEKLRATLGFLKKLTLEPAELTPADAEGVRAAGVDEDALVDAIHVAALFNVIVRMADSLAFHVPPHESFRARAEAMLSGGYALEELSLPAHDAVSEDAET